MTAVKDDTVHIDSKKELLLELERLLRFDENAENCYFCIGCQVKMLDKDTAYGI